MKIQGRRILGTLLALAALTACYPIGRTPAHTASYPYAGYPHQPTGSYGATGYGQPPAWGAPSAGPYGANVPGPGHANRQAGAMAPNGSGASGSTKHQAWEAVPEARMKGASGRDEFLCNWKERMAQPYVYLVHRGDYRGVHDVIRRILRLGGSLEVSGPPFVLYYHDPATTPAHELSASVCLPVTERPKTLPEGMGYEVLPRSLVVYAEVPGAYDQVGRGYGAVFEYMHGLNWEKAGPLREIYFVNPATVSSPSELLAEIQLPVQVR